MPNAFASGGESVCVDHVVVTGALGRAGTWAADRLAREGYQVTAVDLDHPGWEIQARDHIDFRAVDLTDGGETYCLLAELDPDAVVHYAALPTPTRHAASRVFETNTMSTFNVLDAAGRQGAQVVWTSSESAYGYPFQAEPTLPPELPITEDHPLEPEDPYGTSKAAGEEVAKMVARRDGVDVVSLRPSWVQYPGEYTCLGARDDLAAGVGNFWSYIDVRDLASAAVAALETDVGGHEALNIAAADTYLEQPVIEACEAFFGEAPASSLTGLESALSIDRARRVIDWEPRYDWRNSAVAAVETPSLTA